MASNIVPGNVDGAYPKAGQDNSSQGFRDNFTAIKNNFTEAVPEIVDLQTNKANLRKKVQLPNRKTTQILFSGIIFFSDFLWGVAPCKPSIPPFAPSFVPMGLRAV